MSEKDSRGKGKKKMDINPKELEGNKCKMFRMGDETASEEV
ncbi:MAG: hypothetical protein ACTSU5_11185 [Promethearchaeota archaeon]